MLVCARGNGRQGAGPYLMGVCATWDRFSEPGRSGGRVTRMRFCRGPLLSRTIRVSPYPRHLIPRMSSSWSSSKVRDEFFQFFKNKGHTFVPSSSTIPYEDPTLLFANAGMNQVCPITCQSESTLMRKASSSPSSWVPWIPIPSSRSSSAHSTARSAFVPEGNTTARLLNVYYSRSL